MLAGASQSEVARTYGVSQGWISRLMARYREEGEAAFEPRSRRPHSSPNATDQATVDLALRLRRELTEQGHDAGELLRELVIDPSRDYQGTGRPPGPTPTKQ